MSRLYCFVVVLKSVLGYQPNKTGQRVFQVLEVDIYYIPNNGLPRYCFIINISRFHTDKYYSCTVCESWVHSTPSYFGIRSHISISCTVCSHTDFDCCKLLKRKIEFIYNFLIFSSLCPLRQPRYPSYLKYY